MGNRLATPLTSSPLNATAKIAERGPKGKPRSFLSKLGYAAVAYLLFVFGFGLLTSLPGNDRVRRTVIEAFNRNNIGVPQNYTIRYGGDAFTDCLVMNSSVFRHRNVWLDAFDTFWFSPEDVAQLGPCDRLRIALDRKLNTLFDRVDEKYEYTRYWFGQRYLFQLMAMLSSDLLWIKSLYAMATYFLIALLTVISFMRGLKFGAVMGSVGLCLVLGFGIDWFGRSIAHAPACIYALLVACYFAAKPRLMRPFENRLVLAFAAGAGLIYFETLAGSHPFLAALLVTVNYFGYGEEGPNRNSLHAWKDYFRQSFMLLLFFAAGSLYSLAIRFILAVALYDRQIVIGHFIHQAKFRLSSRMSDAEVSLADIASNLWHWRLYFFHGSVSLAAVTMIALGICSVLGVIAILALSIVRRSHAILLDLVALLVPAAAIPLWFVLLKSHTVIHAWLMGRFMVVPASFGLAAFAIAGLSIIEMLPIRRKRYSAGLS